MVQKMAIEENQRARGNQEIKMHAWCMWWIMASLGPGTNEGGGLLFMCDALMTRRVAHGGGST
jgi:hypothetical protein